MEQRILHNELLLNPDQQMTIRHTPFGTLITWGIVKSPTPRDDHREKATTRIWIHRREILLALLVILKRKELIPSDFKSDSWIALFLESNTEVRCPWLGEWIVLAALLNDLSGKGNRGKNSFVNLRLAKQINVRFFDCFCHAETEYPFTRKEINKLKSTRSKCVGKESAKIVEEIMDYLHEQITKLDE